MQDVCIGIQEEYAGILQEYGDYLNADSALAFLHSSSAESPTAALGRRQRRCYPYFTDVETEALGGQEKDLLMVTCL